MRWYSTLHYHTLLMLPSFHTFYYFFFVVLLWGLISSDALGAGTIILVSFSFTSLSYI